MAIVTGAGASDGWAMAIGIDLGFIALELAVLVAPADKRAAVARYATPANDIGGDERICVRGTCGRPHDLELGLAIPALFYALVKVAAVLWIEGL